MPWPAANLVTLNGGWPFGDGPNEWGIRFELRDEQVHAVCSGASSACDQSVMALAVEDPESGYTVTLDMIKSRVADHCLKVHAAELGDAIRT